MGHNLGIVRLIASPAYPQGERTLTDRIIRGLRGAYRPIGVMRQMLAIGADSGRHALLDRIGSPTLVLHGDADPLIPINCGQDTARRISGARFVSVPGMGHDLPPPLCEILLQYIIPFIQAAEKRA